MYFYRYFISIWQEFRVFRDLVSFLCMKISLLGRHGTKIRNKWPFFVVILSFRSYFWWNIFTRGSITTSFITLLRQCRVLRGIEFRCRWQKLIHSFRFAFAKSFNLQNKIFSELIMNHGIKLQAFWRPLKLFFYANLQFCDNLQKF